MADVQNSWKMAEICRFQALRTLRNRTLFINDGARERHALAAFRLAAKRSIGLASAPRATARGFPYVTFPNGIADADNHESSLGWFHDLELMRTVRKL